MKENLLIFGANSDIAMKFVERNHYKYNFDLVSKNIEILKKNKILLKNKYNIDVSIFQYNLINKNIPDSIIESLKKSNKILFAAGMLKIDNENFDDFFKVNIISIVNIIEYLSKMKYLANINQIIALSSVAGERGRATNYIYGSTKAALTQYFSGLRQKFNNHKITISVIKLGFVKTKMTKDKNMSNFLTSNTYDASKLIEKSIKYRKEIVYSKNYFLLSLIIKIIPEFIFKKLKF